MTLEEARVAIGRHVNYTPYEGAPVETGVTLIWCVIKTEAARSGLR